MTKIYVDGCSYTYGLGLDRQHSLGVLLGAHEDRSRPGKSNIAMVEDLYQSLGQEFDTYVVGFTFSSRFLFNINNHEIDMHPGNDEVFLGNINGSTQLENEYKLLHQYFYKFSTVESFDARSDFIVDSTIALFKTLNKRFVVYSWEPRKTINEVLYPRNYIPKKYNQSRTNWHLTESGMIKLKELIENKL